MTQSSIVPTSSDLTWTNLLDWAIRERLPSRAISWIREQIRNGNSQQLDEALSQTRVGIRNWLYAQYRPFFFQNENMNHPWRGPMDEFFQYTPQHQPPERFSTTISPEDRPTARRRLNMEGDSQSNLQTNTNMEPANVEMQSRSMESTTTSNTNRNTSQETAILYKTPVYHLPNTHTCILPTTFYGSGVLSTNYDALDLVLRMNDYKMPLTTKLAARPANTGGGNVGALFSKGLYNKKIPRFYDHSSNIASANPVTQTTPFSLSNAYESPNAMRWTKAIYSFPMDLAADQQPTCKMAKWFENQYDYYTVIGCEYEIIIENTRDVTPLNADIVIGETLDTYSLDATKTQNNRTALNQQLYDCMYWKNFSTEAYLHGTYYDNQPKYKIIKGTHKIGDGTKMVENDGDAQRWTRTTRTIEADNKLIEEKHWMFWPHPFSTNHEQLALTCTDAGTAALEASTKTSFNFQVNLKYIVQFKDLKQNLREFQHANASTFVLTYNDMAVSQNQSIVT